MGLVAIIGLGCRFPGGDGPNAFWEFLLGEGDAITEVPANRWDKFQYYDRHTRLPGKMNTLWGGFLDEVFAFDANFFGIGPREADYLDPQQRLFLEVAWEALENSGRYPRALAGTETGVYAGVYQTEYRHLDRLMSEKDGAYAALGTMPCLVANRLSYVLDLKGPSLTIDTASSASLVAIHQACQALEVGDCDLAIAGGVNLILEPLLSVAFSQAGMLSPNGKSRSFDAHADKDVR